MLTKPDRAELSQALYSVSARQYLTEVAVGFLTLVLAIANLFSESSEMAAISWLLGLTYLTFSTSRLLRERYLCLLPIAYWLCLTTFVGTVIYVLVTGDHQA